MGHFAEQKQTYYDCLVGITPNTYLARKVQCIDNDTFEATFVIMCINDEIRYRRIG